MKETWIGYDITKKSGRSRGVRVGTKNDKPLFEIDLWKLSNRIKDCLPRSIAIQSNQAKKLYDLKEKMQLLLQNVKELFRILFKKEQFIEKRNLGYSYEKVAADYNIDKKLVNTPYSLDSSYTMECLMMHNIGKSYEFGQIPKLLLTFQALRLGSIIALSFCGLIRSLFGPKVYLKADFSQFF
ncbi:hypothetical protein BpHYR1_022121 [Brachionus plicatilis]|uniref:Uncharacterized protein n=1 Tax=Brachionus plicatilis TaxID=10195 RepID=A0A3M7SEM4_BRAPC|nr:hypothetical protein BpHYR1_022121 [Brachionus plicatilis]